MGLASKLSFSRDRLMECFFWTVGMVFEPQFSDLRKGLTKGRVSLESVTYSFGTLLLDLLSRKHIPAPASHVFASDIGRPIDELVRLSIPIVTNKLPTRSVDEILSKLTPLVHNNEPEDSGANKNN